MKSPIRCLSTLLSIVLANPYGQITSVTGEMWSDQRSLFLVARSTPVDRELHSSTNRSSCCSKKSTTPAIGLSGAVCELVRALAFGTLAAGIGTIIPATVRVT
jgi:hypothetical protein